MIKRTALVFSLCLLATSTSLYGFSDERSERIVGTLTTKLSSMGAYRVEFTARADGNVSAGEWVASGESYRMSVDGLDIIGDGSVRYEINHGLHEITIDRVDPADRSILSNPAHAFDFTAPGITSHWIGEESIAGRRADKISLVFKGAENAFEYIHLLVYRENSLPAEIRYKPAGITETVVVSIRSIQKQNGLGTDYFRFDRSAYNGYEIIDFR